MKNILNYKTELDLIKVGTDNVKKPVGIFLHGFGASAKNISLVCQEFLDLIPYWIVPQAPITLSHLTGEEGYAWFPKSDKDLESVLLGNFWKNHTYFDMPELTEAAECVHNVIKQQSLLDRKIVLAGFSQGGIVASELALLLSMVYKKTHQKSIIDTLLLFSSSAMALERWTTNVSKCIHFPKVAVFHGSKDTVLLPKLGDILYTFWHTHNNNKTAFFGHDDAHTINSKTIVDAKKFLLL